jgi:hypothetical protein
MASSSNVTLEDLENLDHLAAPPTTALDIHLSYPAPADPTIPERPQQTEQPKKLLKDRLYVGNLHPSVDEYV